MEDARQALAHELLDGSYDELTPVQRSVIDLIVTGAPTGVSPRLKVDSRTAGQRVADAVASIGGSWSFLAGFGVALAVWMGLNLLLRPLGLAFDPYPFIFLNLLLSTLAAVQAPIIMMSQNRAAQRDREAAEHDYIVNLRAELEIMHLHGKIDRMRWRELADLKKQQTALLGVVSTLATRRRRRPEARQQGASREQDRRGARP